MSYNLSYGRKILTFNGSSDRVTVLYDSSLDITDAITLEARIKPDSNVSSTKPIIYRYNSYRLYSNSSPYSRPEIGLFIDGGWRKASVSSGDYLSTTSFNHVVATYDSSEGERTQRIYIDGVLREEGEVFGYSPYTIGTGSYALYFGGDGSNFFDGDIDYIRLYNRMLSLAEIQGNQYGRVSRNGLVSWWRFNEGTGTDTFDSVGDNDGVIS